MNLQIKKIKKYLRDFIRKEELENELRDIKNTPESSYSVGFSHGGIECAANILEVIKKNESLEALNERHRIKKFKQLSLL